MGEVFAAVADLLGEGLVTGRCAANNRGDPGVPELEAVFAVDGARFVGEAEIVQDGIHEVAGAVACEGATCAIGTMGAGSETEKQDTGERIPEARNGTRPVGLVDVGATTGFADGGAIGTETGATIAEDDSLLHLLQLSLFGGE